MCNAMDTITTINVCQLAQVDIMQTLRPSNACNVSPPAQLAVQLPNAHLVSLPNI